MDYNRIRDLLNQYLEGQTTLQEEAELRSFFTSGADIPKDLFYAKAMFSYSAKEKELKYQPSVGRKSAKKKLLYYISGVAASLLLAAFFMFSNLTSEEKIVYAYINGKPIYDKEIATDYSRQALLAVSQNLDQGTKSLNHLSKINKVEQLVKKK